MSKLEPDRIAVLSASVADQIAAGEVIERPASALKELLDNAIDAGATRIEVELERGGTSMIRVLDDGCGIHADDLQLALTRHATSKISSAAELEELASLGFRGEALASIAGVAKLIVRSRRKLESIGRQIQTIPNSSPQTSSAGMPTGTQVEICDLFANIPARKKFLRGEATETGHCSEAVLRTALVHNNVHFSLRTGKRELLLFPICSRNERVQQVLGRRGDGPFFEFSGESMGVRVWGCFGWPKHAIRSRQGMFSVVRRRVVRERNFSQIIQRSYGDLLASERYPVACLFVDPPEGTVDVNVHPQKTEVRFSDAQTVYAAVREILAHALCRAPWRENLIVGDSEGRNRSEEIPQMDDEPSMSSDALGGAMSRPSYRLATHAKSEGYDLYKRQMTSQVDHLRDARRMDQRRSDGETIPMAWASVEFSSNTSETPTSARRNPEKRQETKAVLGPDIDLDAHSSNVDLAVAAEFELLRILPGPVALFLQQNNIVAVDLYQLRSHLLRKRLERDLGGGGVEGQTLLQPVVVEKQPEEVEIYCQQAESLLALGIVVESFGANSLLVRSVPAHLCRCTEEVDISDLLDRVLPWLRLRNRKSEEADLRFDVAKAIAHTKGRDPTARMARKWISELKTMDNWRSVPGVVEWTPAELVSRN